ncbi:MAG: DUF4387 domain-containing protein [Thermomicrobiales bacterium]|nr:DUF4387 domain-containing protein [Thermomicrobiales bacterium]
MTTTVPLHRIAKTIRSKNAGAHYFTFDIIFDNRETYERVKKTGVITRDLVRELYGVGDERIAELVEYDKGNAIKITLRRSVSSGDVGDTDLYGCQQYIPLLDIPIPWSEETPGS